MSAKKKLKLLAWSDGPTTTTGFGRASREILKALYKTGKYEITSIGINYFGLTPQLPNNPSQSDYDILEAYHNYNLIPARLDTKGDPYGRQLLLTALKEEDFDLVWLHQDSFNLQPIIKELLALKQQKKFKVLYYFPIDTKDLYPYLMETAIIADAVAVYNNWSLKLFNEKTQNKYKDIAYAIELGYNPNDFYPISKEERQKFRREFFNGKVKDDDILIIRSDSNQQRKDWHKTFQIVAGALKTYPNIKFYANTTIKNRSYPLYTIAARAGLTPGKNFLYLENFTSLSNLPQKILNKLYNAADIGITTSRGEGCGLFHYEMMALGKPILISNNSAHTEAIKYGAAYPLPCGLNKTQWTILPNDLGMRRPIVDVKQGVKKLKQLIKLITQYPEKRINNKGIEFMKDKTWEHTGKKWIEVFEKVENTEVRLIHPGDKDKIEDFKQMLDEAVTKAKQKFIEKYKQPPPDVNYLN